MPASQVEKLRLKEGKHLAQCHTVIWRQSWDSVISKLLPRPPPAGLLMRIWEVCGSSGELGGGNPDFTSQEAARSVHPEGVKTKEKVQGWMSVINI